MIRTISVCFVYLLAVHYYEYEKIAEVCTLVIKIYKDHPHMWDQKYKQYLTGDHIVVAVSIGGFFKGNLPKNRKEAEIKSHLPNLQKLQFFKTGNRASRNYAPNLLDSFAKNFYTYINRSLNSSLTHFTLMDKTTYSKKDIAQSFAEQYVYTSENFNNLLFLDPALINARILKK